MHLIPETLSWTIHSRFNLDNEGNVPTWFSSTLLYSVSVCSVLIYFSNNRSENPNGKTLEEYFWFLFSSVYCFLSLDEAASVHEIIDQALHVKWVYVYAPFAAIFFMICSYYIMIIRNNESTLRNWILGGLIIFAFGSMGAELIAHITSGMPSFLRILEAMFEEGLEMIGTIMVLIGCLKELSSGMIRVGNKHITFK